MTTTGMARDLAAFLVPIGTIGAVLAIVCAIVAGIAIARGASGLAGGAVGVWIPFALLSVAGSFANQWWPLIASGAALAVMLVLGGIGRAVIGMAGRERAPRTAASEVVAPTPAMTTVVVPSRSAAPATGTIAVVR